MEKQKTPCRDHVWSMQGALLPYFRFLTALLPPGAEAPFGNETNL